MKWYIAALKKYAIFNGRSRRTEYWMFILFNLLIAITIAMLETATGVVGLSLIYGLAMLIPGFSVTIRRLHDTDRSGWWLLISLVPLIGWIIFLIFMVLEGKPERNRFGPDPKRVGAI